MKKISLVFLCLGVAIIGLNSAHSQNYLYATGNPTFSSQIPIENGFINVNNGDIHIEIPLATHQQRGRLNLNERLVYDSRIWKIITNGSSYSWSPTNIPGSMGGWAFYSGIESGSVGYRTYGGSVVCESSGLPYSQYWYFNWTDPQGTTHYFPSVQTLEYGYVPPNCNPATANLPEAPNSGGYASDGSGYYATVTNYTNVVIRDKYGNQFSPSVTKSDPSPTTPEVYDSNGNYWSQDSNGNLIDTLGRTPVEVSQSGNQIYYDVLGFNGARNRYTVTTETINYNTDFAQTDVADESGSFVGEVPIGDEGWAEARLLLGDCNYKSRRYREAIDYYLSLLSVDNKAAAVIRNDALRNIGCAYHQLGDYVQAAEYLSKIKDAYDEYPSLKANLFGFLASAYSHLGMPREAAKYSGFSKGTNSVQ